MPLLEGMTCALFVAGGVAMILGARRLGLSLMAAAVTPWIVFPILRPLLGETPLWLFLVAAAVVIVFAAVNALQRGVGVVYGRRVGDHVAGTYLVRILDGVGRVVAWSLLLPFRTIGARGRGRRR